MNCTPAAASRIANRSPLLLALLLALAIPVGLHATTAEPDAKQVAARAQAPISAPRIQLAILLDTSSSMDGLIDQARQQLWTTVNELARARRGGLVPHLEVAVFEYGNSGLSQADGYTRQVIGLSRELDQVSEALFSLTTNGGDEYCGHAIASAVQQLQWSQSPDDVRAVFIAGNEPFTQGPTPFAEAIAAATQRGIVVNTIHAGGHQDGISGGWQQGAVLAGGSYMSIDQDHAIAHIDAPQDDEIARLNASLNETYVPFGEHGASGAARQAQQDSNSLGVSGSLLAKRAQAKSSALYDNSRWDLVDAVAAAPAQLDAIADDALPEPMQGMDKDQRRAFVEAKAEQRASLQSRIAELARERDAHVAALRAEQSESAPSTLQDALTEAARKQAESKRFSFSEK